MCKNDSPWETFTKVCIPDALSKPQLNQQDRREGYICIFLMQDKDGNFQNAIYINSGWRKDLVETLG
jgi:hypothetical protein